MWEKSQVSFLFLTYKLTLAKIASLLSWVKELFLITILNEISFTQSHGLCLTWLCPLDFLYLLFYSFLHLQFYFPFFFFSSSSWVVWLIVTNEAGFPTTGPTISFFFVFQTQCSLTHPTLIWLWETETLPDLFLLKFIWCETFPIPLLFTSWAS